MKVSELIAQLVRISNQELEVKAADSDGYYSDDLKIFEVNTDGQTFVTLGMDTEHEDEYDGQPDEAQEWHDFDPDC